MTMLGMSDRVMSVLTVACLMLIGAFSIVGANENKAKQPPDVAIRTNQELCDAVAHEVRESVRYGLFTTKEANQIIKRCRRSFPPHQSHQSH